MLLTLILSVAGCILLFLCIWGVTMTMPTGLLVKNFPEDVQEKLKLAIPEHCLGWTFLVCPIAGLIVAGIGMLFG